MTQRPLPTAAQVERALGEVYARPELAGREPAPLLKWIGERWAEIRGALAALLDRFHLLEGSAPAYWLVIVWLVLVLCALGILAHIARSAWRGRERRARAAAGERGSAGRPAGGPEWEAEARRLAAAGRLREASLALYQALLLRLDARGAVRYDPSKTPGDYRREARKKPDAARALDAFLRRFEPVAFGGRALDGAGYDALARAAAEGEPRG